MVQINKYRLIDQCRLCDSPNLKPCFDFGEVPLGNNLVESHDHSMQAERYPLAVNRCVNCGHFQLTVAVAPELLYATNYTYLSGVGKSFVLHFKEYASWVQEHCEFQANALVVDVGSNDGTCLKEFKKLGLRVCGVDPASTPAQLANEDGIYTINSFFDDSVVDDILEHHGSADFITSHNVLAHVDDLRGVFRNIYRLLKSGGYFCFEIGYFDEVVKSGCFDTIYHEHLDYHHAQPLAAFLCDAGFELVNLSTNNVQGGSLRLFLRKTGKGTISSQARKFLEKEAHSVLYNDDMISKWPVEVKKNMMKLGEAVRKYVIDGKTIAGYGVPTKATLLMEISELGASDIWFMVEDNRLKTNKFMPASGVPIFDVAELKIRKPDIVIIFAWNFYDDIISKLKGQIDWSMKVLVPLPVFFEVNL